MKNVKTLSSYDKTYCYVGPNSWPQTLLRMVPYWRTFNYCAYVHDMFFSEGGNEKDMGRANRIFRTMCFAVAKTLTERLVARFLCICVDVFGHCFFNYKNT